MNSVLLDTSFLIRLLSQTDKLHDNAKAYFRYFMEQGIVLKVSTIAIAEYCVKGNINELPLQNLMIVPFNFDHAIVAGDIHKACNIDVIRNESQAKRSVVINDIKMLAQAQSELDVSSFVTSDANALRYYNRIQQEAGLNFSFIDINIPVNQYAGRLF